MKNKKYCIVGTGGFGREVICCLMDVLSVNKESIMDFACFMVDDDYYTERKIMGVDVIPFSSFNPELYKVVVAIGDSNLRKAFVDKLPKNTSFAKIIHPSAVISDWVEIGEGSIVTARVVLTCNIRIGKHAHLNLNTTIGHDSVFGDFFTTAPGVNISGNSFFGDCVYFGTNSFTREKITICDCVTIGMGAGVVKNISEKGVYVGLPAVRIR